MSDPVSKALMNPEAFADFQRDTNTVVDAMKSVAPDRVPAIRKLTEDFAKLVEAGEFKTSEIALALYVLGAGLARGNGDGGIHPAVLFAALGSYHGVMTRELVREKARQS